MAIIKDHHLIDELAAAGRAANAALNPDADNTGFLIKLFGEQGVDVRGERVILPSASAAALARGVVSGCATRVWSFDEERLGEYPGGGVAFLAELDERGAVVSLIAKCEADSAADAVKNYLSCADGKERLALVVSGSGELVEITPAAARRMRG